MAVIWTQEKCECKIEDYGYGRTPKLDFCVLHTAGEMLLPLVQALVEANDSDPEQLKAAMDRVIPQMSKILGAYKTNRIEKLWAIRHGYA